MNEAETYSEGVLTPSEFSRAKFEAACSGDKILVSACLAGFPCRYDGKAKTDATVVELVRQGHAIPLCPEQLGGLPMPRPACEVRADSIVSADGADFTAAFVRGAETTLALAQQFGCQHAILKAGSPSWVLEKFMTAHFRDR